MIEIRNLKKSFKDGENITEVLKGIDFVAKSGEFIAVMGRSGAGKSTFLYQMSLLDEPTEGDIFIDKPYHELDFSKDYSLEDDYLDNVTISEVRDAILMLPREFREVIMLSDISGLMYEEIAKIIKVPVGTVRSRLHRGRLILKERLKEKYDAE